MIHGLFQHSPNFLRKSYKILLLSNLYSQAPDFVVLYDWKTLLFIRGCGRMKRQKDMGHHRLYPGSRDRHY